MIWRHTGYTINEALSYGVPLVVTPLSILKELPITENERIILNFDQSNIEDVARQIFEKKVKPFKYTPPEDNWSKILAPGKSTYEKEKKQKVTVRCVRDYYDLELCEKKTIKSEPFQIPKTRAEYLKDLGFVEEVMSEISN